MRFVFVEQNLTPWKITQFATTIAIEFAGFTLQKQISVSVFTITAASRIAASVSLRAPSRLFGRFGIASSASDRAAAEGNGGKVKMIYGIF